MGLLNLFNNKPEEKAPRRKQTEQLARKAEFFHLLRPYYEAGLIRDIYKSDHLCILAFGELVYIACQYNPFAGAPVGIYVTYDSIKKMIKKNKVIYSYTENILSRREKDCKQLIYLMPKSELERWKAWKVENQRRVDENEAKSRIDPEFEKEIQKLVDTRAK